MNTNATPLSAKIPGVDDVIARIRAFKTHTGKSKSELALDAGLSVNALRDMDKPEWSPTADTLRQVEKNIPASFTVPTAADKAALQATA